MTKKKLLIASGCSYTEGEGAYDINHVPDKLKKKGHSKTYDEFLSYFSSNEEYIRNYWHVNSWPAQLGELLKFDKVINLGHRGSSTSGQFKNFIERFENEYFPEYDVYFYHYLSEPSRISFYSAGIIQNTLTANEYEDGLLSKAYVDYIDDVELDPFLEQLSYCKALNLICKEKNWTYLASQSSREWNEYFNKFDPDASWYVPLPYSWTEIGDNYSILCGHPNEKGYKIIASRMFHVLYSNKLIPLGSNKNKPELEYLGDPIDHTLP